MQSCGGFECPMPARERRQAGWRCASGAPRAGLARPKHSLGYFNSTRPHFSPRGCAPLYDAPSRLRTGFAVGKLGIERKRRNVYKVAVAYAVVATLLPCEIGGDSLRVLRGTAKHSLGFAIPQFEGLLQPSCRRVRA
jgi:hypothetical protein